MISSIDKIYCNFDNPKEKEPKKEKESRPIYANGIYVF